MTNLQSTADRFWCKRHLEHLLTGWGPGRDFDKYDKDDVSVVVGELWRFWFRWRGLWLSGDLSLKRLCLGPGLRGEVFDLPIGAMVSIFSSDEVFNHDKRVALGDFDLSPLVSVPADEAFMGYRAGTLQRASLQLSPPLEPRVSAVAAKYRQSLGSAPSRCMWGLVSTLMQNWPSNDHLKLTHLGRWQVWLQKPALTWLAGLEEVRSEGCLSVFRFACPKDVRDGNSVFWLRQAVAKLKSLFFSMVWIVADSRPRNWHKMRCSSNVRRRYWRSSGWSGIPRTWLTQSKVRRISWFRIWFH
jgi:hypothetical protein